MVRRIHENLCAGLVEDWYAFGGVIGTPRFCWMSILEPQLHSNASGRELELELIRVRAEAAAVRLEARAAELELMLLARQSQLRYEPTPAMPSNDSGFSGQSASALAGLDHQRSNWASPSQDYRSPASGHEDAAQSLIQAIRRLVQQGTGSEGFLGQSGEGGSSPVSVQEPSGWESRLNGLRSRGAEPIIAETTLYPNAPETATKSVTLVEQFADRIAIASQAMVEVSQEVKIAAVAPQPQPLADVSISSLDATSIRVDAVGEAVKRPHLLDRPANERPADPQPKDSSSPKRVAQRTIPAEGSTAESPSVAVPLPMNAGQQQVKTRIAIPVSISEAATGEEKPKRWRPAGWLVSTTAHVVGLLLLGLFTLANPKPKDQLAFTASVSEASETAVESFTIETAQEMPDIAEPTPAEMSADVSPLGTMPIAEVSLDLPKAVAPPMTAMSGETSNESMKLAKAAVKGDTLSKVQFAGLDGGGNHFVYLVDSSNSMKKFNDARTELLRSIDSLKPDQRFYVVFYDENPKYMRITNPSQDEPASVYATPESKQTFRRWAMAVQQARGQSPPEVLKFAFKLRPDVIFLLSDGEFTAQTETVIRENNLQENLFGESGPISIIHTIRYPGVSSTEGRQAEVQMQRIASENGGQYRNVDIK